MIYWKKLIHDFRIKKANRLSIPHQIPNTEQSVRRESFTNRGQWRRTSIEKSSSARNSAARNSARTLVEQKSVGLDSTGSSVGFSTPTKPTLPADEVYTAPSFSLDSLSYSERRNSHRKLRLSKDYAYPLIDYATPRRPSTDPRLRRTRDSRHSLGIVDSRDIRHSRDSSFD